MKVKLDKQEWWPVFTVEEDGWYGAIELTEREMTRIKAAFKEFDLCQDLIKARPLLKSEDPA